MTFDLTWLPLVVGMLLGTILLLNIFGAYFSFNKGIIFGPFQLQFESTGIYELKKRNLSDVTHLMLSGPEIAISNIVAWAKDPNCALEEDEKKFFEGLEKETNPLEALNSIGLDLKIVIASRLFSPPFAMYVLYRYKDDRGQARPFPSNHTLARKRRVFTMEGFLSMRLLSGLAYRLPLRVRYLGLSKKDMRVYIFVPKDDAGRRDTALAIEKIAPSIDKFVKMIPTERQYGGEIELKDGVIKQLKAETKRMRTDVKEGAGITYEGDQAYQVMQAMNSRRMKVLNASIPLAIFIFPILGGFGLYYIHQAWYVGVVLGDAIAMMLVVGRR